ncbi:MAG: FAD-dependent oxidoreductase [Woeseia sp.]
MISRDLAAAREKFDVVIVGGGFYGATLLLEAARRGLRSILLEKADFGAGTSFNSLKIVHGGLRYLQHLDVMRFNQSVRERRWFLQAFPELVTPLPCLMPLKRRATSRKLILRVGLTLNDLLSWQRNSGVTPDRAIPPGKILSREETERIFPRVNRDGLVGAALWYDAYAPDSNCLLLEILRRACNLGATALNYVEAVSLRQHANRIEAVSALDHESGQAYEFAAGTVINAAGPQARLLAAKLDHDIPELFRPSIGWNVLVDRPALSGCALALTATRPRKHTYFLVPWKDKLLIGTGHAPWVGPARQPRLAMSLLTQFLDNINTLVPGLELEYKDILRILLGFLPATKEGGMDNPSRPLIVDHGRHGGPIGLYSVSGAKFTTARLTAEKTLDRVAPRLPMTENSEHRSSASALIGRFDYDWMPSADDNDWLIPLAELVANESVVHLEDLVFRRTSIGDNPVRARVLAPRVCQLFGWDRERRFREIDAVEKSLNIERLLA